MFYFNSVDSIPDFAHKDIFKDLTIYFLRGSFDLMKTD